MADILRRHYVRLISDLRQQELICNLLLERRVLTDCDIEDILCKRTNSSKNQELLDYIRCRFRRAFPVFCEGLELSNQLELYELMKTNCMRQEEIHVVPNVQMAPNGVECKVCLSTPAKVAFVPCGHVCCCEGCARQLNECPLCRAAIQRRMTVYL